VNETFKPIFSNKNKASSMHNPITSGTNPSLLFILAIVIVLGLIVAFSIYLAWMFIQRKKKNKIILWGLTSQNAC